MLTLFGLATAQPPTAQPPTAQPPTAQPATAQPSSPELTVVGRFVVEVPDLTTDVWAHGNYAYLGSFGSSGCSPQLTGVRIIDIRDPANPALALFLPARPGTRNNDVKVAHLDTAAFRGDLLAVTHEPCSADPFTPQLGDDEDGNGNRLGVDLWDVTDPTAPRALSRGLLGVGVHNVFLWQQDERAYLLAVDNENERDVRIVDISDPSAPRVVSSTGRPDWPALDSSEISGPAVFLHDAWVAPADDRVIAYLAYWDAGLVLLDVTDPAAPRFLGDSRYPDPDTLSGQPPEGNAHVAVPSEDGRLVILGDEDFRRERALLDTNVGRMAVGVARFGPDPLARFPSGRVVPIGGEGCDAESFPPAADDAELPQIALIDRGSCFFAVKAANAQAAGYDAYLVANDAARGNGVVDMSAQDAVAITIPGLFIGFDSGRQLEQADDPAVLALTSVVDGEGYMRVLDVSDPRNIVELGAYASEGVLGQNRRPGVHTAHNVVVRDGRAYWAWYAEGVRVVDFSSCLPSAGPASCTPTEIAHYLDDGSGPDDLSGHSDVWGVVLHDHPNGTTYLLASDRDSGLIIFALP